MKLENKLTVIRIILLPAFFIFTIVQDIPFGQSISILIFIFSILLGMLNNGKEQNTKSSKIIKPLLNTILISTALIALAELNAIPAYTVIIIIDADFAVSGLISIAISKKITIKNSFLNRIKTTFQIISIIFALLYIGFKKDHAFRNILQQTNFFHIHVKIIEKFLKYSNHIMLSIALIATVISCIHYFCSNRNLFVNDI
jgi:CDP-diacylglycerol---glycerol-3-phosphate 3-phosphatidyltransferase